MIVLRRLLAVLLALVAVLLVLLAGVPHLGGLDHTIEHSRQYDQEFRAAAARIDAFRQSRERLPSEAEADTLLGEGAEIHYAPRGFNSCDLDDPAFSRPPAGHYVLWLWRGEWFECFAPVTGENSLTVDPADYTATGFLWLDTVLFALMAIAAMCGAVFLWRCPNAAAARQRE